ncbi:carboxymuconolactone decarboxylase family protein [Rhodococcus sp. NPDC127530]|uniref:carboxymuconolactone decarboxylase family protein n=1 Tax=Rhodococcus TaxID=1827 RepID=UPI00114322D4|nr:carboxymuconolactone decarboxylase family protein [Rhodococcus sp. WS4]
MPRLKQVSRTEVTDERILAQYDKAFGSKDPVAEPGTHGGTPGHWWTVYALDPQLFGLMQDRQAWQFSEERLVPPVLRELAITRAGWVVGSQFVFSQHTKMLRKLGVDEEMVTSVPHWGSASCYSDIERAVLAYTDDLVANTGRTTDELFEKLKKELSDRAILELTFMILTYQSSATMARALRLEFDDRPEQVVEIK